VSEPVHNLHTADKDVGDVAVKKPVKKKVKIALGPDGLPM
jgi:hypothetical protein